MIASMHGTEDRRPRDSRTKYHRPGQHQHARAQQANRLGDPRHSEQTSSLLYSTHGPTQWSKRRFKAPVPESSTVVSHPLARASAQQSQRLRAQQRPDRLTWSPPNANQQRTDQDQQRRRPRKSPSHKGPARARGSPRSLTRKDNRISRPPNRSRAKLRCPPRRPEGAKKP